MASPDGQAELFVEPTPVAAAPRGPAGANHPDGIEAARPGVAAGVGPAAGPGPEGAALSGIRKTMQSGCEDQLMVLARKPTEYFVKRYERTVFVSPAKSAPVAMAGVLPPPRVSCPCDRDGALRRSPAVLPD